MSPLLRPLLLFIMGTSISVCENEKLSPKARTNSTKA